MTYVPPRPQKFKIEWIETGDSGEVVKETYVRMSKKIDSLFLGELEKRTGQYVYVFESFVKDIRSANDPHLSISWTDDNLNYHNGPQGLTCKISLFRAGV